MLSIPRRLLVLLFGLLPVVGLTPLCAEDTAPAPAPSSAPTDASAASSAQTSDASSGWPLVVTKNDWEVKLFFPRAESLDGDTLKSRAAFSISSIDASGQLSPPSFGVVWLSARAETDRESRTITLSNQRVSKVLLSNATDQDRSQISDIVATALGGLDPVISLDRVLTTLEQSQKATQQAAKLNTAPPSIQVAYKPSMLLLLDGEPRGVPIADTHFDRIENTPFMLASDMTDGAMWLYYGSRWYTAPKLAGPWRVVDAVPDRVSSLVPKLQGFQPQGTNEPIGGVLTIVPTTKPEELISFDGQPAYEPVAGGSLQAATNTDRNVFVDPASKLTYVLLSGRWFSTPALDSGTWTYVPSNALPADFSHIPADSKYADVRSHVAGTTEADEAVLDTQIPQTATVKRDATITVSYAGDPQFQQIPGSSLQYSINSAKSVIEVSPTQYYCCYQGVWYMAPSPQGPWSVATATPPNLDSIPPDSPVYNTRYVYVYDSTPDYCYVGYYPGYTGCYAYNGCVVWGTGYSYPCWYHNYYFPHPWTWGFGFCYNPFTCAWGSDIHAGYGGPGGWWAFGVHGAATGWWGPSGYRSVYIHSNPPANVTYGRIPGPYQARVGATSGVIYRHAENSGRIVVASSPNHPASFSRSEAGPSSEHQIYSSSNGNVYRRQGDNWQQWQSHGWNNVAGTAHTESGDDHGRAPVSGGNEGLNHDTPLHENGNEATGHDTLMRDNGGESGGHEVEPRENNNAQIEELNRQSYQQDRGVQRSYNFQQSRSSSAPMRSPSGGFHSSGGAGGFHASGGGGGSVRH